MSLTAYLVIAVAAWACLAVPALVAAWRAPTLNLDEEHDKLHELRSNPTGKDSACWYLPDAWAK